MTYVQLTTTAFGRDQLLRMESFIRNGWVPLHGPVLPDGRVEGEFFSREEIRTRTFDTIEQVARRKSAFSHGANYTLIVSIDDRLWFGGDDDLAALRTFVDERVPEWELRVDRLCIVGLSGRTFATFPVPASGSTRRPSEQEK